MVKYTFAVCVAPAKYIVSKSVNVSLLCVAKTYTDVVHQISVTSTHYISLNIYITIICFDIHCDLSG